MQPNLMVLVRPLRARSKSRPTEDGGTLRSPWKWEELIVESSVVGGRTRADGGARWRRRLKGLAADFRLFDLVTLDERELRVDRNLGRMGRRGAAAGLAEGIALHTE